MDDATFQSNVRRLLEQQGKSQAALAQYLKLSPSHLSRVLKGERPTDRALLEEIAGFLDVSLEKLVAGTEHEDIAVPGHGSVDRATYELLLERLREAMSASEVSEANLAGEREKATQLEQQLAAALEEVREATARAVKSEQEAKRTAIKRKEQLSRVKSLEKQVDELSAARSTVESRLQQIEGQLHSENRRVRTLLTENERLQTQVAVMERKATSLQAALKRATFQVTRNYDAWVQAESQRQELAKRLQSAPGPGAMLLTGLIGLGAGILASGGTDEDEYE